MLMGEYAVLKDYPAVVAAINQRITATLTPSPANSIIIQSALGEETIKHYHTIPNSRTFSYITECLRLYQSQFTQGFTLNITSDFSSEMGLGSSAAVTVAVLSVLSQYTDKAPADEITLLKNSLTVIHAVQGKGSGADAAASIFGGVIQYKSSSLEIEKLAPQPALTVIYSGHKTTTTQAIQSIEKRRADNPESIDQLYHNIGTLAEQSVPCFKKEDWKTLGKLFQQSQEAMTLLDVSTNSINQIINTLEKQHGVLGAKISGSGLGDCVIALGTINKGLFPENKTQKKNNIQQLTVAISPKGVLHHVN
jgi:mevalonate kinase